MPRPYLTVLTLPILPAARRLNHAVRRAIRMVVKPGVPVPQPARYPGHYALVRSVVEGITPFSGLHKDVKHLADRIAELEAKLEKMEDEET